MFELLIDSNFMYIGLMSAVKDHAVHQAETRWERKADATSVEDADINKEIALAVLLDLALEIVIVIADAAENQDLGQDQAALVAILLAMERDTTKEAILQREKRELQRVAAADHQKPVNAHAAILAATAEETHARLHVQRAQVVIEDQSQEKPSLTEPLQ
jgi:hypothetical protein